MNHSIATANRTTHLKIVVVALIAGIMVVTIGIAARLGSSGVELAGVDPRGGVVTSAQNVVVPAQRPVTWTSAPTTTIR